MICQFSLYISVLFPLAHTYIYSSNVEPGYYADIQDINIGVLGFVHNRDENGSCRHNTSLIDLTLSSHTLQQPEAVYFAVKEINQRTDILPNISLGFVFLDGCLGDLTSLARSAYFIPEYDLNGNYIEPGISMNNYEHFDVDGVIIHAPSRITTLVAGLMSAFNIPTLGTIATSDDLSDKEKYPYFSRMSPPDNLQTKAIVDILKKFNWSYVSFIYTAGSYGQSAARYFNYWVKETEEICIAFSYILPYEGPTVKREVSYAVDQLVKNKNAKVVVIILEDTVLDDLLQEIDDRGLTGEFIWLGSDALEGVHSSKLAKFVRGAMFTSLPGDAQVNDDNFMFDDYFKSLNPWNTTSNNPWLANGWEWTFKCIWNNSEKENTTSCLNYKGFGDTPNFEMSSLDSMLIDAVYIFARAFDKLLLNNCPEAFTDISVIKYCINSDLLTSTLRSLKFKSFSGPIEFNDKGDLVGGYDIKQIQETNDGNFIAKHIGNWDVKSEDVTIQNNSIKWYFKDENTDFAIPESVCSKPCGKRMAKLKQELTCCWLCHQCYDYEYLADNGTFCKSCPLYMWPEETTLSYCLDIEINYLTIEHPAAAAVLAATLLGIVLWIGICQQVIYHRKHKLILACDREQSWYQLCGILVTFVTSFLFLTKPSQMNCTVRRIGFNISVTILYGPLLIKTIRVYRIFKLSKQGIKSPKFVSRRVQRLLIAIVCIIQVILITVVEDISPSFSELRMPLRHKKYVELVCAYELWAYLTPLSYNIALIFSCATLGLLTRKLPENFNEAWFIFVSVATTLFAWVILLPTYFNIFYGYHQEALLALCLIITSYILLFCHYFPKIYAIVYVKDAEKLHIKKVILTTISTTVN